MTTVASISSTITASFLGSLVEVVEAFTIILAVGVTQGWRPAFLGTGLAIAVLAVLVLTLGPLLGMIPIELMQFVIGTLLILFGMRWLRKAILRAAGFIALHDEEKAFVQETNKLRMQTSDRRANLLAAITAFKAVLLEGIEVVFIVIATGAGRGMIGYASVGAVAACLLVLVVGFAVHKPLSTVPENSLKFAVGLLLSAFGIFWVGEGIGAEWPGDDLALLSILLVLILASFALVRTLQRYRANQVRQVVR
ncbi:COG4280 domain-containing protein [Rhizobium grahamii]|uniref:Putative transmembrane protein n=1 Tax=Rhizobium grahamii CCGE 502 TaxID=990285 RepID=S3HPC4_9HYPH|nr:COG4280 domain-containing protein [Rhizobium grahamii]EPF00335.1 putative transmembrane protein [Rhizobium grahamii CCGE 502]